MSVKESMKVCKYCNSLAYDSALECSKCGASDFGYQCENCGTICNSRFCPHCGRKVGPKSEICPRCGMLFVTPTCPRCGFPEVNDKYIPGEQGTPTSEKAKKTTFGTVLLWIFFLPVMLLITVWKAKKLAVVWKVLITCLVLFVQIFPYISSSRYESLAAATEPSSSAATASPTEAKSSGATPVTAYEITYQNARVYQDQLGLVFFQGIVEIENIGSSNLVLTSGAMDFEDAAGNLLAAEKGVYLFPDILLPGEKGYLYCQMNYESAIPDTIKMIVRPKVEGTDSIPVRLTVSDVSVSGTNYGEIRILGRVENTTDKTQSLYYIAAVLFDENQVPVAVISNFFSEDIEQGEKFGFELDSFFLPQDITAESVSDVLLYAYPMLDISSYIKKNN